MSLRLLQLGLGGWGLDWARTILPAIPEVTAVGFVEPDPAARERAEAKGLPADRLFASLEAALESTEPDAALVVVPLAAHHAAARETLEAGLPTLVEKPFTATMAEARDLVDLAEAQGRLLMVDQNYRWFPAPRTARRLIAEGALGAVGGVILRYNRLYDERYRYFFLDQPLLSDMAIHHFDLMRFVLDDAPVEVTCRTWREPETPFQGPPAAACLVRFARGTIVSYYGSWIARAPLTPFGGQWQMDGSRASLVWTTRGEGAERLAADRLTLHRTPEEGEAPALETVPHADREGALIAFTRAVTTGEVAPDLPTGRDNLQSLALMLAAIRSAEAGGPPVEVAPLLEKV